MAIIKNALATVGGLALFFSAGVYVGNWFSSAKIDKAIVKAQKHNEEMAKKYAESSAKYYTLYMEANEREPVTVTKRVYVRAECDSVPTGDSGSVGESGSSATRARLHQETVDRITAVTEQAHNDLKACRIALQSLLDKVEK